MKWLERPIPVAVVVGVLLIILMRNIWFGVLSTIIMVTFALAIIWLERQHERKP